jgi:hypothetical protein
LADVLATKARFAAFAATGGRDDEELDSLDADGRGPSLPPFRRVLSMRVFFSGDGLRDSFMRQTGPGDRDGLLAAVGALDTLDTLDNRLASNDGLRRGGKEGRWGSGGRYRSP